MIFVKEQKTLNVHYKKCGTFFCSSDMKSCNEMLYFASKTSKNSKEKEFYKRFIGDIARCTSQKAKSQKTKTEWNFEKNQWAHRLNIKSNQKKKILT